MASSVAITARTTISSISVKPVAPRFALIAPPLLPSPVGNPVEPRAGRQRIHVEHVVALLRRIVAALVAALPPGRLVRLGRGGKQRGARTAAQEIDPARAPRAGRG